MASTMMAMSVDAVYRNFFSPLVGSPSAIWRMEAATAKAIKEKTQTMDRITSGIKGLLMIVRWALFHQTFRFALKLRAFSMSPSPAPAIHGFE